MTYEPGVVFEYIKKAVVLNEEGFKALVSDFVELAKEEFKGRSDLALEELEEFLGVAFEEVLDVYEVDYAMLNLEGEWYTVVDGKSFVSGVVKRFYKDLSEILSDMEVSKKK
jgi:hypothetical protein